MSKATPRPWRWFVPNHVDRTKPHMKFLVGADDQGFCHTVGLSEPTDMANADLIIRAVNTFDQAREALKSSLNYLLNTQRSLGIEDGAEDELNSTKLCRSALAAMEATS